MGREAFRAAIHEVFPVALMDRSRDVASAGEERILHGSGSVPLTFSTHVDEFANLRNRGPGRDLLNVFHRREIFGSGIPGFFLQIGGVGFLLAKIPNVFDLGVRRLAMLDPGIKTTIEEADGAHSGMHQPPDESCRGHDAIGITAIDDNARIRSDAKVFKSEDELGLGHEV